MSSGDQLTAGHEPARCLAMERCASQGDQAAYGGNLASHPCALREPLGAASGLTLRRWPQRSEVEARGREATSFAAAIVLRPRRTPVIGAAPGVRKSGIIRLVNGQWLCADSNAGPGPRKGRGRSPAAAGLFPHARV